MFFLKNLQFSNIKSSICTNIILFTITLFYHSNSQQCIVAKQTVMKTKREFFQVELKCQAVNLTVTFYIWEQAQGTKWILAQYIEGKVFFVSICSSLICNSGRSENGDGGRAPNLPPRFWHSCTGYSLSDVVSMYLVLITTRQLNEKFRLMIPRTLHGIVFKIVLV